MRWRVVNGAMTKLALGSSYEGRRSHLFFPISFSSKSCL